MRPCFSTQATASAEREEHVTVTMALPRRAVRLVGGVLRWLLGAIAPRSIDPPLFPAAVSTNLRPASFADFELAWRKF